MNNSVISMKDRSIKKMFSKMQTLLYTPSKQTLELSSVGPKNVQQSTKSQTSSSSISLENMSTLIKNSLNPIYQNYVPVSNIEVQNLSMNRIEANHNQLNDAMDIAEDLTVKKIVPKSPAKTVGKKSDESILKKKFVLDKISQLPTSSNSPAIDKDAAIKYAFHVTKESFKKLPKISCLKKKIKFLPQDGGRIEISEAELEDEKASGMERNSSDLESETMQVNRKEDESVLKPLACTKCFKTFSRKYHLDRHLKLSSCSGHPPQYFPCELCNRTYSRKDNLREHLRQHTGDSQRVKKHKCTVCDKAFHGTSLLTIHLRTHTGERPFACEFCPKKFPSVGAMDKHRRTHTGEKPFKCAECGHSFSLTGTLKRHMRTHTGIRPHKCKFCDKEFIQIGGLKAHMFYHTGENGFKCDDCGKMFNRKARLEMHRLYVHENHRPFKCDRCSKSFTRKEDLSRHTVLHTGERPYKCPICSKQFAIKPSLKLHLLTHTKEEPRSCHECGRAFIRKDCLLRHMRKRHRDLLDKILVDEKDEKDSAVTASRMLSEEDLCENIAELLSFLVEESTLVGFGWPDKPVDEVLESVIRRCGHTPVIADQYSFMDRMRENAKLLFTVVIDDNAVKTLLNNQTVDEVILHVLRLAKT